MFNKKVIISVLFLFTSIQGATAQETTIERYDPLMFYFHHIRPNLIKMHITEDVIIKPKPAAKPKTKTADVPKNKTDNKPQQKNNWIITTFRNGVM